MRCDRIYNSLPMTKATIKNFSTLVYWFEGTSMPFLDKGNIKRQKRK